MRLKLAVFGVVLGVLALLLPMPALAQNVSVEWNRWDAQISVRSNSDQMQIAETQEVRVLNGSVREGTRFWTTPVQIQSVYVMLGNDQNPRQLNQGGNGAGSYTVSQSGNQTTLNYTLPTAQNAGGAFVVQINYLANSPTSGMVDWKVVPADHAFPVRSSTVRIRFPNGQAPDSSLIRVSNGQANVQANGNEIVIQSQGQIPAQQAFGIQVPFGSGVGVAGNPAGGISGSNPGVNPVNPNDNPGNLPPQQDPNSGTPGFNLGGNLLPILCVLGLLVLFGGGSLLRNLFGGILGGGRPAGGGLFGGGYNNNNRGGLGGLFGGGNNTSPMEGPGEIQRGFRPSANQDRQIGNIGNDKDSGGGASFG